MKPMLTARQFTVHSPTPTVPTCLPTCLSLPTVAPFACAAAAAAVAVASIKVSGAHRVELQLELELASPIKSYVSLHVTHVTMDMYVCVCVCTMCMWVPGLLPGHLSSPPCCWSTVCMCRFVGKTFTLHSINLMDQSIVLFDEMQKKEKKKRRSSRWRGLASRESSH